MFANHRIPEWVPCRAATTFHGRHEQEATHRLMKQMAFGKAETPQNGNCNNQGVVKKTIEYASPGAGA